jgi:hypothetical protein
MKHGIKKTRGIRKPRGFQAGNISLNLHMAEHEHISGSRPVSFEAAEFLSGCESFSKLIGMKLKCAGKNYEVILGPRNRRMMKFFKFKKVDLEKHGRTLGLDICERILWAIENEDGYFFKDLARLCETPSKPNINLRYWLILTHWRLNKGIQTGREQDSYFTACQLCEKAFKRGFKHGQDGKIPERRMHEICCQLGIRLLRCKGWGKLRRISN